jgi:hypothetical protein
MTEKQATETKLPVHIIDAAGNVIDVNYLQDPRAQYCVERNRLLPLGLQAVVPDE